jgi:hypothetical protein
MRPAHSSALGTTKDFLVRLDQFSTRFDAEFGNQPCAGRSVKIKRVGLIPGRVQNPHENGDQRFVKRMLVGQCGQRPDYPDSVSDPQFLKSQRDDHIKVLPAQAFPQPDGPQTGQPGQRITPPRRQRLAELPAGCQAPESMQIDLVRVHLKDVTTGPADQPDVRVQGPDPGDVGVQAPPRALRRILAPNAVDQRFGKDHPSGVDSQCR